MPSIAEQLSQLHLFRNVEGKDLDRLVTICPSYNYSIRQTIFTQGSPADHAMLLVSGRLEVSIQTDNNVRHIGEIHPGEIFGEQGLFHNQGNRNATVMANQASICIKITPDLMRDTWNNPAIVAMERHLIGTMARRIRTTNLAIQKVWKDSIKEEEKRERQKSSRSRNDTAAEGNAEENSGLLGKLRSIFGGK